MKWDGEASEEFGEGQGIHQGGLKSADAFNCKADPIIYCLSVQPDGFTVGTTNVGAMMVANDLALASSSLHGIQSLITIKDSSTYSVRPKRSSSHPILNNPQPTVIESTSKLQSKKYTWDFTDGLICLTDQL